MKLKTIYQIIAGVAVMGVLSLASCGKESASSTANEPAQSKPSALERILKDTPKKNEPNKPNEAVDELVGDCDELIGKLSNELKEIRETNKRILGYRKNLASIQALFQEKNLVTQAKSQCNALIDQINGENKSKYLEVKDKYQELETHAKNLLTEIGKVESEINKEVEVVSGFLQRFGEIKTLVIQKSYYEANDRISSLLSDIEKFNPKYDSELVFRASRDGDYFLGKYKGIGTFRADILGYKSNQISPKIAGIEDIVRQFNTLCSNYDSHLQKQDIDKLLEYDVTLQKMNVVVSKKPYSDHKDLCGQVEEKGKQVYETLRSIAKARFDDYKSKIKKLDQEIESNDLSPDEMDKTVRELILHRGLLKKYKSTLFSDRYLK